MLIIKEHKQYFQIGKGLHSLSMLACINGYEYGFDYSSEHRDRVVKARHEFLISLADKIYTTPHA